MSFFRYPGGKRKLAGIICEYLSRYPTGERIEYREPFFGGGYIGVHAAKEIGYGSVWINDLDPAIAALWNAVINNHNLLKNKVREFQPSVDYFNRFRDALLSESGGTGIDTAFKKLCIHQMSYSGLGTKAGGPIGGYSQTSKYSIGCRWSPEYICKKIDSLHATLSAVKLRHGTCTSFNFSDVILDDTTQAVLYIDPPYYVAGSSLYQYSMSEADHLSLAGTLRDTRHDWVLSYDDCATVRAMYSWADIGTVPKVKYSIVQPKDKNTKERTPECREKPELIIRPRKR